MINVHYYYYYYYLNDSGFICSGITTVKGCKKNAACNTLSCLCGYKHTANFEHQGKTVSNLKFLKTWDITNYSSGKRKDVIH